MMSQPLIIAFAFGSQLLLSGLALAGIPLLIHLLHRRQFVETQWAAMRFLLQASKKQSSRSRIEQLLLLLLRTIAIAAFVIAMSRPTWQAPAGATSTLSATHRILVFDATYSMQFEDLDENDSREFGVSRFEKAKKQALELVGQAQTGDLWSVIRVAQDGADQAVSPPSPSRDFVLREIQDLKVSDARGDLSTVLQQLQQLVKQASDTPQKEIVVYSDMQPNFWAPLNEPSKDWMKAALAELNQRAKFSFVNVASGPSPNVSVTELRPERAYALLDRSCRVVSMLRNSSSSALRGQIVDLLIDDRLAETKRVDLPADVSVPVDWQLQLNSPGEHLIEIHVQDDQLPIDNRRRLVLPVRNELRALVVDASSNANQDSLNSTAFYVMQALAPKTELKNALSLIRPMRILATELATTNTTEIDVIVLCGGWKMTEREIQLLEAFVSTGGGLIVFPGEDNSLTPLNESLYRDGQGILPGKLVGIAMSPKGSAARTFDVGSTEHPLIREFRRNPGSGLEATLIFRSAKIVPNPNATAALRFSDHEPAIVESTFGRGQVLLFGTSPLSEWSTWGVLAQSFIPILHEAVLDSVKRRINHEVDVGQPVNLPLPLGQTASEVTVRASNGNKLPIRINNLIGNGQVNIEGFGKTGTYRVDSDHKDIDGTLICVNPNSSEGILVHKTTSKQPVGLTESAIPALAHLTTLPKESRSGADSMSSDFAIRTALLVALLILLTEPILAFPGLPKPIALICLIMLVLVGIAAPIGNQIITAATIAFAAFALRQRLRMLAGRGNALGCRPKSTPLSSTK